MEIESFLKMMTWAVSVSLVLWALFFYVLQMAVYFVFGFDLLGWVMK